MELQVSSGIAHYLQTAAIGLLVLAALWILPRVSFYAQLRKIPSYIYEDGGKRSTYLQSAKKLYNEGNQKFKDQVWHLKTSENTTTIVVPSKFLPELRKLPDSVLSFPASVYEIMHAKYTKLPIDEPISVHAVRADLTPALARLNPIIDEEVKEAMAEEMPPCEEWTSIYIYMKLVNAVAKVSGRVFVGPDLCRNKDYLDAAVNYTMDIITAQQKIQKMRPWLRPFLAPRLKEVAQLDKRTKSARELIAPIVTARREAEKNDPKYEKPQDMMQWLMDGYEASGQGDYIQKLAQSQLALIFAAIHTTTLTATNILYTLASTPECIEPLRDEIRTVIAENEGVMTYRALQQMEKLDSYMKEVMRFYPPGLTSFGRKVLIPFTLSNGQTIPAGVNIEVPSHAIYQDNENYPNGDTFDGFRAYKLRQKGGASNIARNQFVTTNEQNLAFGYGRHACPGRFFAANEIKMILARIILEYDIKNPEGVEGRHPNLESGRQSVPDASKALMFRKAKA